MGEQGSKNQGMRSKLRNARRSKHRADLRCAELAEQNGRMGDALRALEAWDMLSLDDEGRGVATADAPFMRALIADALTGPPLTATADEPAIPPMFIPLWLDPDRPSAEDFDA